MDKKVLKPFDLDAALAGKPVIMRDGRAIRKVVGYLAELAASKKLLVIDENGDIRYYIANGKWVANGESGWDLFMAPTERTVWVNAYNRFDSEVEADGAASLTFTPRVGGKAHKIVIEE